VSRKILREHGGDVRVESTPEVGSKFYLEFPATIPTTPASPDTLTEQFPCLPTAVPSMSQPLFDLERLRRETFLALPRVP